MQHEIQGVSPMKFVLPIRALIFGLLFSISNAGFAANFEGKLSELLFFEQGDLIYVYFVGGTKDRPACSGSNGDYISFSMKRPRAREYLAGLMMAFAAGKTVRVATHGQCIDQSVSDTLIYYSVLN
jgi:hypothetical protein